MSTLLLLSLAVASPGARPAAPAVTTPAAVLADSTDTPRDRPLTVDFVKKVGSVLKQMDPAKVKQLDSIARAKGAVGEDVQVRFGGGVSRDSALKARDAMVARAAKMYDIPEGKAIISPAGITPAEYAWGSTRVNMTWTAVKLEKALAERGTTPQASGLLLPATDADIAFVKAHEADLKAAGFPEPQVNLGGPPAPSPADAAANATDSAALAAAVHVVKLVPLKGDLGKQLASEFAAAKAAGEVPVAYVGDKAICGPCRMLEKALLRPTLSDAFKKVRVIELSPVLWVNALGTLGYCPTQKDANGQNQTTCSMPTFLAVGEDGHAAGSTLTPGLTGGGDPDVDAKAVAPQFASFFDAARAAMKK